MLDRVGEPFAHDPVDGVGDHAREPRLGRGRGDLHVQPAGASLGEQCAPSPPVARCQAVVAWRMSTSRAIRPRLPAGLADRGKPSVVCSLFEEPASFPPGLDHDHRQMVGHDVM